VRAVATSGLSVAADPVAGEREQQRGLAEPAEIRNVEQEAGGEPDRRTPDRATQERHGDERHEQEVRRPTEDVDRADDRRLEHHRGEHQCGRLEDVEAHRTSTVTERRFERLTLDTT
jgi:hypothetical protein